MRASHQDALPVVVSHELCHKDTSLALTMEDGGALHSTPSVDSTDMPHYLPSPSVAQFPPSLESHGSFHRLHLEEYHIPNSKLKVTSPMICLGSLPTLSHE